MDLGEVHACSAAESSGGFVAYARRAGLNLFQVTGLRLPLLNVGRHHLNILRGVHRL
jgi:hypothetical protein